MFYHIMSVYTFMKRVSSLKFFLSQNTFASYFAKSWVHRLITLNLKAGIRATFTNITSSRSLETAFCVIRYIDIRRRPEKKLPLVDGMLVYPELALALVLQVYFTNSALEILFDRFACKGASWKQATTIQADLIDWLGQDTFIKQWARYRPYLPVSLLLRTNDVQVSF